MAYKSRTITLSVAAGLVALASVAAAQSTRQTQGAEPQPEQHHGMRMGEDHAMMKMPGMDAAQMREMMANCNRMMSATSPKSPEVPRAPTVPDSKPKG